MRYGQCVLREQAQDVRSGGRCNGNSNNCQLPNVAQFGKHEFDPYELLNDRTREALMQMVDMARCGLYALLP